MKTIQYILIIISFISIIILTANMKVLNQSKLHKAGFLLYYFSIFGIPFLVLILSDFIDNTDLLIYYLGMILIYSNLFSQILILLTVSIKKLPKTYKKHYYIIGLNTLISVATSIFSLYSTT